LVGGSPCQDLSIAKRARAGLLGNRSGLFLEYVRILREKRPAYFVLENVASMNNKDRDFISETLAVEPIMINSALLTAQNRKRYYRTNIPNVVQPNDKNIGIQDILEAKLDDKYYIDWQAKKGKQIILSGNEKTPSPLIEVRTEEGKKQRENNKQLFGIDSNKRNKETVQYIA
jgi:site-specific DNA-cytosine methylase